MAREAPDSVSSRPYVVPEFPRAIEIQTITACNAACVICPHPQTSREIPGGRMSRALFERIIDECGPHQRTLRIIPYLNAEPFLDKRMIELLALINARCPGSEVEVSTNVSMLTRPLLDRLADVRITELRLSVFGFTGSTHQALMPGLDFARVRDNLEAVVQHPGVRAAVTTMGLVMIMHPLVPSSEVAAARDFCVENGLVFHNWGFLDRARNVRQFSNHAERKVVRGCEQARPLERLHVRFNGDVILCCQDWRDEVVVGSIATRAIGDLWRSPEYDSVRRSIYSGVPDEAPALCQRCVLAL